MSEAWLVNEPKRMATLAELDILDTPPEEAFDRIVHRITQVCNTPVGLISLVADHRQWFKARVGFAACETPINRSVCKYTLDHFGLLVIPDLTQDPRTYDNSLVTDDPYIRFYAGARIVASDGVPIGSLCVIDYFPRPAGLTSVQAAALQDLALECSSTIIRSREKKADEPCDRSAAALSLNRIARLDRAIKAQHQFLRTIPDPDTRTRAEANLIDMIAAAEALREAHANLSEPS